MGTLTGAGFQTELRDIMFKGRSDAGLSDARLLRWTNWAYSHLTHPNIHRFREVETEGNITLATADGDYTIDVLGGINVVAVQSIYHLQATAFSLTATKRKVNPRSKQWFDDRTVPSSAPVYYGIWGNLLYTYGVPTVAENNQLLRVSFIREPAALMAGTVTIIPNYWDEALLVGAKAIGEFSLGYLERAELSKQSYAALVNEFSPRWELEGEDEGFEVEVRSEPVMGPV